MPENAFGPLSLTTEEERIVRLVLHHLRLAAASGQPILMLWPQVGGTFLPPIPASSQVPATPTTFLSTLANTNGATTRLPHGQPESNGFAPAEDTENTLAEESSGLVSTRKPTCKAEILKIFRTKKGRLSAGKVQQRLQDAGKKFSLSTVEKALLQLQGDGILDNVEDGHGSGYGLSDW